MTLLKLVFKREIAFTMLAMSLCSSVCVSLVIARIFWTAKLRYGFLVWNLFLAWVPLLFALLAAEQYNQRRVRGWRFGAFSAAWLLFFPNAPYIFTDLIHLTNRFFKNFWVDLSLVLCCALAGLVAGFVSLYIMHSLMTRLFGRLLGWAFVIGVAGASSFGIYLGRFLRFNSWDILVRPFDLYHGIGGLVTERNPHFSSVGFLILFAAFLLVSYVMLYGLTHLRPPKLIDLAPVTSLAK